MSRKRESLQSRIEGLRKNFFADLPGRLDKIDKEFHSFLLNPDDSVVQKELHREIHNIKGTAASFGVKNLSAIAVKIEPLLKVVQKEGVGLEAAIVEDIRKLLLQLHLESEKASLTKISDTFKKLGVPAFELETENITESQKKDNKLIYICDDDVVLLDNMKIQLSCFTYLIEGFSNSVDLLKAVEKRIPDVIVMDIVFSDGELEGFDCIRRLHSLYEQKIPVIFVSGRSDFETRLYAVQSGGVAYISKPFKIMELIESLDVIFTSHSLESYRILIVDDDPQIAEYHSLILQDAGMSVRTVTAVHTILDVIHEFKPDLMLVAIYMPVCSGPELAQLIRQIPEFLSLPIVYLSSETEAKNQFSALKVGADGFLTKPIDSDRLISEVLLRTERMAVMRSLMLRDSLTGLLNHTAILKALETAIADAKRRDESVAFAMIDIDHFKKVNDSYGHPMGDQVLLALSRIFMQRVRKSDFVGRYGGEEFAVILTNINIENSKKIVDELRQAFQEVIFNSESATFSCTFSGGVAIYPECDNVLELVEKADSVLYEAKSSGRNRIVCRIKERA